MALEAALPQAAPRREPHPLEGARTPQARSAGEADPLVDDARAERDARAEPHPLVAQEKPEVSRREARFLRDPGFSAEVYQEARKGESLL